MYSVVHVAMETTKTSNFTVSQNLSSVYFSLAKFQLVSCNLSLAIIWQMPYTQKLPKLCSATLIAQVRYIKVLTWLRDYLFIFNFYIWFGFLCVQVSSGNCQTMGLCKICNFHPKSSMFTITETWLDSSFMDDFDWVSMTTEFIAKTDKIVEVEVSYW